MTVVIDGTTGIDAVQNGTVAQADLAANVAGNGPAFSAYQSSSHNAASSTWTKVQLQTEEFDTASCFDNVTNFRFTPNVAGYYQVNGAAQFQGTVNTAIMRVGIYKNGSSFKYGAQVHASTNKVISSTVSALIYFNGSTDYVELYAYQDSGTTQSLQNAQDSTYFQASFVRAA